MLQSKSHRLPLYVQLSLAVCTHARMFMLCFSGVISAIFLPLRSRLGRAFWSSVWRGIALRSGLLGSQVSYPELPRWPRTQHVTLLSVLYADHVSSCSAMPRSACPSTPSSLPPLLGVASSVAVRCFRTFVQGDVRHDSMSQHPPRFLDGCGAQKQTSALGF